MNVDFRTEYPRPQFVRKDWICLNGVWDFTIDHARSGEKREFQKYESFDMKINVPFCPQSKLSGIEHTDFIRAVWYTRTVDIPDEWQKNGRHTFINIGACDFFTKVFINGELVGEHRGGYTSFSFDITEKLVPGENRITIHALDEERDHSIASGKQSENYNSYGCFYTRTTGIWQPVWLENTPSAYIKSFKMTPNVQDSELRVELATKGGEDMKVKVDVSFKGEPVTSLERYIGWDNVAFSVHLDDVKLWDTENPNLYDIKFTLGDDVVESYFGMRDIALRKGITYLNGKPIFQRLILDQGFYPDGIYTAPSEEDLIADITRGLEMGYNGARLHEKVFEPRFLYHCDRMGYMVWGEYPNWGIDTCKSEIVFPNMAPEWLEAVLRDYNHPALIGWAPMNETGFQVDREFTRFIFNMTKAYDPTRLFIGNSGWCHVPGTYDMMDVHDYCGDPKAFREKYWPLTEGKPVNIRDGYTINKACFLDTNEVCFLSEFGGASWVIDKKEGEDSEAWGYGDGPKTEEEFIERYKGLVDAMLDNKAIGAFCYTQLYDIELEINGLYTYDRRPKFDAKVIKEITSRKAACEE